MEEKFSELSKFRESDKSLKLDDRVIILLSSTRSCRLGYHFLTNLVKMFRENSIINVGDKT